MSTNLLSTEGLTSDQIDQIQQIILANKKSNIIYKDKEDRLRQFKTYLEDEELASNSIEKYLRDAEELEAYIDDRDYTKDLIREYKANLKNNTDYKISTINSKITSINKYLKFLDREDLAVNNIKVQKNHTDSLTNIEYERIYRQAQEKGTPRDELMLELLYNTGIRVSEMKFFTVEAVKKREMEIYNKGKVRSVPINSRLNKIAKQYIKDNDIKSGSILLSQRGKPMDRTLVYKRIQFLGGKARGIKKDKLHPHSIRALFSKNYLAKAGNTPIQLADILGHSSLETTRRYTSLSTNEARETMEF